MTVFYTGAFSFLKHFYVFFFIDFILLLCVYVSAQTQAGVISVLMSGCFQVREREDVHGGCG